VGKHHILIGMLALVVGGCFWNSPTDATYVDTGGGIVYPSRGAELAPGSRLVVPAGALGAPAPLTLELAPGSDAPLPQAQRDTILGFLPAHPLLAPLMAARAHQVGPTWILGPDGTTFAEPATIEIDLGSLAPGDNVVALQERSDGTTEVIVDGAFDGQTLRLPVTHFSTVKLISVVKEAYVTLWTGGRNVDWDSIDYAIELVGPRADEVATQVVDAQCGQKAATGYDPAMLPDYLSLLNNLARTEGDIGGLDYGEFAKLQRWLGDIRLTGRRSATIAEIYEESLRLTGNDAFRALVLAHEVLRADREHRRFADLIEPIRGDGTDELGARYHLFGMAIYGFWEQYQMRHGDGVVVPAEVAAFIEETMVSQDISSDSGEFVVDMVGAELGRQIFEAIEGPGESGFDPCAGENNDETPTPPGPVATEAMHFTGSGSMTVSFSDAEGFCEIPATVELTLRTDGTVAGSLTFAPLDVRRDTRDDGTPFVECVDGQGGTGPISGSFGDGTIRWTPGEGQHTYTGTYTQWEVRLIDTWIQPVDDQTAAITQMSFVLEQG